MSWILIGMIQKSSFNLFKKSANTAFLLPSHDSRLSVAISSPPRSLPSRIMPCQMISSQKAKRKKKCIFQNSHLAGQLSMFLSTSIQFPIPVSTPVTTSLRIDHTCRSWNILTGPMSSLPPNSLRDWFHFSIQHPLPLPEAFASFLHSLLSFAIHISCALGNGLFAYFLNQSETDHTMLAFSSSCLAAF